MINIWTEDADEGRMVCNAINSKCIVMGGNDPVVERSCYVKGLVDGTCDSDGVAVLVAVCNVTVGVSGMLISASVTVVDPSMVFLVEECIMVHCAVKVNVISS